MPMKPCRERAHPNNAWQMADATNFMTIVLEFVCVGQAGVGVTKEGRSPNGPAHEE